MILRELFETNFSIFISIFLFSEFFIWLELLLILIFLVLKFLRKKPFDYKKFFLHALFSLVSFYLIKIILDYYFGRPRPYLSFGYDYFSYIFPTNKTFLSGHSGLGMIFAVLSFRISKFLSYFNFFLSTIGGILRSLLLIHWPYEVIASWWIAFLISTLLYNIYKE